MTGLRQYVFQKMGSSVSFPLNRVERGKGQAVTVRAHPQELRHHNVPHWFKSVVVEIQAVCAADIPRRTSGRFSHFCEHSVCEN